MDTNKTKSNLGICCTPSLLNYIFATKKFLLAIICQVFNYSTVKYLFSFNNKNLPILY